MHIHALSIRIFFELCRVKAPVIGHVPVMGPLSVLGHFLFVRDPPTPEVSKLNRLVISLELVAERTTRPRGYLGNQPASE